MRYLCLRFFAIFAISLASFLSRATADAEPYLFQAGPMIGHVTDSSAVVWLRVKSGANISATAVQDGAEAGNLRLEDLGNGFHRLHFNGLSPARSTDVRIDLSREGDATERSEVN